MSFMRSILGSKVIFVFVENLKLILLMHEYLTRKREPCKVSYLCHVLNFPFHSKESFPIVQQSAWLLFILKILYFPEPWPLAMPWQNTLTLSWFFNCDLKYLKSLSQTPFIGIVKGFFNGNGFGYDVYVSRGAENYDFLISKVIS
jgi:hypothetical protein